MGHKIAILGGGVAGLSAAHELIERGYDVDVFEAEAFGGKARSTRVAGTETPGRKPLPGEHGFRFFPGFYRHLFDTLDTIPYGDGVVRDNLVATSEMLLARAQGEEFRLPAEAPNTVDELDRMIEAAFGGALGFGGMETLRFSWRMWVFLTSCKARREQQWEKVSWWDFIRADERSKAFQRFLAEGATRSLVAMRADKGSTRTIATIYIQMYKHLFDPNSVADSLLNGPTNEVWIDPWVSHLKQRGVNFFNKALVQEIRCDGQRVTGVVVAHEGATREIDADHYIAALPVEIMIELLSPELLNAAPALRNLDKLETAWMTGIQFYLDHDVKLSHGHGLYLDSKWALTSISQAQFWKNVDLSDYGDGTVSGILSVCISDWETPGDLTGRGAMHCSAEEIKDEVWFQLKAHLNDQGLVLDDANVLGWNLDDCIRFPNPSEAVNGEPLLINVADTLRYRPEADLGMPNFYVASDYVRTNTDLATMEAANEAAKRATNAILDREGHHGPRCDIYEFEEWSFLEPFKILDRLRFAADKPNIFDR